MTTRAGPIEAKHVLCVGVACVDHVLELDRLPEGEGKQHALSSRWGGGGIAATAAVAVARLGGRATWHGVIGDDPSGAMVVAMMREAGVQLDSHCVRPGATSPISSVLVGTGGERWLGYHLGDGLTGPYPDLELPSLGSVDAVMADQIYPELSAEVLLAARERGIPRVLDVEHGDREGLVHLGSLADHVIFSSGGLTAFVKGAASMESALEQARNLLGVPTVAVTLGRDGSLWISEGQWMLVPAPSVEAMDTTGCGDVFHGTYALGLAEGLPVGEAARFATAAAALKARQGRAWEGMPRRPEVEALALGTVPR